MSFDWQPWPRARSHKEFVERAHAVAPATPLDLMSGVETPEDLRAALNRAKSKRVADAGRYDVRGLKRKT